MINNIRISQINIVDSRNISVIFTSKLSNYLTTSNVSVYSQTNNVPDPQVLSVSVVGNVLNIKIQPLTPFAAYYIEFNSTASVSFISLNGDAILLEDGVANKQLILGPIEQENVVQDFLVNYLRDNIYNITDNTTLVSRITQGLSVFLSEALYNIRQSRNENYLTNIIVDEQKVRGNGPFDRLNEECAYEVVRVGFNKSNTPVSAIKSIPYFPYYPISLYATDYVEILYSDTQDLPGKFNRNNFNLNVSNAPVSKLKTLVFNYNGIYPSYTYDITKYGYQITDSKYDQDYASSYVSLTNKQFKLNQLLLQDANFHLDNIYTIQVEYEYRNLGVVVDETSLNVYNTLTSVRETLPPIINVFNLKNAPIVDNSGNIATYAGVSFLDANSFDKTIPHPAFLKEITFRFNAPPANPGEYSIDYSTGTVYVYGSDLSKNGTTGTPPLATYNYTYNFVNQIDYVYDNSVGDIVSLPYGNLRYQNANISFNYEQVLVPNVDYVANIHEESLNERIGNNLVALNAIQVNNGPVTNVFRIYNETTGEIYNAIRWFKDKVYFSYQNAPNVQAESQERASFENILNELMFVNTRITNASNILIFKVLLNNNNLMAASEDGTGSVFNTSVYLSNNSVFKQELWFDSNNTETYNINRLTSVGNYLINYSAGVVYCAVSNTQSNDIGTISYKHGFVKTLHPHIISVDDLYYQVNLLAQKNKEFKYNSFSDGLIQPTSFDPCDESFLNNTITSPYQVYLGKIGSFVNSTFVQGVSNSVKYVRGVYEFKDLTNNTSPINFASATTFNNTIISLGSVAYQDYSAVAFDGTNYYVNITKNIPYISSNITYTFSVIRETDGYELYVGGGSLVAGSPAKLILSGLNSPVVGNPVVIKYSFSINDLSRVIVDYNKGEYYVDYSYLADEILISYEYGDNNLDFRSSNVLSTGDQYYVSYKVGALRDGLIKNFGNIINIPVLTSFDIDLERERYRDALKAALESFIQGPTVSAIKNIVKNISHIQPQIIESIFDGWSLGSSILNPEKIQASNLQLASAKYGSGAIINSPNQSITFPSSSNLKVEQGTLECWVLPQWYGIDNDANLTFKILKDGYNILPTRVFVGAAEYHPTLNFDGSFPINKAANTIGLPSKNKDGVYIYYNSDPSGLFNRWYVDIVDGYGPNDGYTSYSITINSNGAFYDTKTISSPISPTTISLTTGVNTLKTLISDGYTVKDGYRFNQGFTFISDIEKYIFDCGELPNKNRFSIYKDAGGYINFRVFDNLKNQYSVSSSVASWKPNDKHHVAVSWKLNTKNDKDEMHLFIDGFEVPNIVKYGNKFGTYLHEKFRTVDPEEIAGVVVKNIVGSNDLSTTLGSNVVSSLINFSSYGILNGDILYINQSGFNTSGYTITNVNGQTLTLSSTMPFTLKNLNFSVNQTSFPVLTEVDVYPNIAVSTISSYLDGYDGYIALNSNVFSTNTTNFLTNNVSAGDLLRISDGYFQSHYVILSVSANSVVINGNAPKSTVLNSTVFHVYHNSDTEIPGLRSLYPSYNLTKDGYHNNILTITNSAKANDIIWVKTLGLNHRRVRQQYYIWGNASNIIGTKLPTPIYLNEVKINHVLLPQTTINSLNSTVVPTNHFTFTNTFTYPDGYTSDIINGRTLTFNISATNINFANPFKITVFGDGYGGSPISEIITYTSIGDGYTVNKYINLTSFVVDGYYTTSGKSFTNVKVKERYPITTVEGNSTNYPVLRYSYQTNAGTKLSGSSFTVNDPGAFFSIKNVGDYLSITSGPATGYYLITAVSTDNKTLTLATSLPATATNATYQVLNVSAFNSGFQNGYFVFELANQPKQPYYLQQGFYEFDFYSYIKIGLDPFYKKCFVGTDYNGNNYLDGIVDDFKISSNLMTDTRVGETAATNVKTITKDFNSLKGSLPDINTLMLINFSGTSPTNSAYYYTYNTPSYLLSTASVNSSFTQSLVIDNNPLILNNNGIIDPRTQGTIEFWINPTYDTYNDPNLRFYFDTTALVKEEVVSKNNVSLSISGNASQIISVKLKHEDQSVDYFSGGKIEISADDALSQQTTSLNSNTVVVSKKILQVVSVKIVNDPTNVDYFANGVIGSDGRTIYLGKQLPVSFAQVIVVYKTSESYDHNINPQVIRLNKPLPFANTPVVITYVPSGTYGDRMSIYKDKSGYINFNIKASNTEYIVRAPAIWSKNTWHRIKAMFKVNGGLNSDEMRLFVDGYEQANILFGSGLLFGDPHVFGSTYAGTTNIITTINFKDPVNEIFIGTDFTGAYPGAGLLNNLRISNIERPVYKPFGESIDVGYNSNASAAIPVTNDLYTTFLLDSNISLGLKQDFAVLRNLDSNNFDFNINVFDSFDIITSNSKIQQILEALINSLKPASSRVYIQYII